MTRERSLSQSNSVGEPTGSAARKRMNGKGLETVAGRDPVPSHELNIKSGLLAGWF